LGLARDEGDERDGESTGGGRIRVGGRPGDRRKKGREELGHPLARVEPRRGKAH